MTDLPAHLRPLEALTYSPPLLPAGRTGTRPDLAWLPFDRLVVDQRYQREIMRRGAKNIRSIVEGFDWARFTPVIVAPVEDIVTPDGHPVYAVIDGQHRTTAALMHPAIAEVPCQIVYADLSGQALAFMKINAAVTKVTPLQLHAAALNGGDDEALALDDLCLEADVLVMRYPVPSDKLRPGQTLAIGALKSAYRRHGAEILRAALTALRAADAFGGKVNQHTIKAYVRLAAEGSDMEALADLVGAEQLKADLALAARRRSASGGQIAGHLHALLAARAAGKRGRKAA